MTLVTRDVETPYSGMLPGHIAGLYTREDGDTHKPQKVDPMYIYIEVYVYSYAYNLYIYMYQPTIL